MRRKPVITMYDPEQFNLTISEAFRRFIAAKKAIGISDKTARSYTAMFASMAHYLDVTMQIEQLQKGHLDTLVNRLRENGLSPHTIRSYTATLKTFLSWCNEQEYTGINIQLYKAPETFKEPYTDAELMRLLKKPNLKKCKFNEYRTWVIVNLLINNGCRAATIRNIQIRDLDLENKAIKLRHNKNGRIQTIPLCSDLVDIFREYLRFRKGRPDDCLFPNEYGEPMSETVLRDAIVSYNHKRGVAKTSIHLFRHTFAKKYLLDCGGNAFMLQKLLGHSTLDMTRHYCALYDADIARDYDSFSPLMQLKKR